MIRAKELGGRAVVDVDAAEKLGRIDRIVLDPESRRVAGFVISRGSSFFNNEQDIVLSASCVHAVGPDAVTVRGVPGTSVESLETLPRVSDIAGRKVVSESGRLMGTVDDVLIDETDGRIVGYALEGGGVERKIRDLVSGDAAEQRPAFLRADANLRAGRDLIVAPDDAVSYDWDLLTPSAAVGSETSQRWVTGPRVARADSPWLRSDSPAASRDTSEER